MTRRVLALAAISAVVVVGVFVFLGRQSTQPSSRGSRARESARPRPDAGTRATADSETPAAASRAATGSRAAPESAPTASPELGTLRIDSDVPGAQVFIDRQFVGTTPMTAERVTRARIS